ncbi:pulmonary surfactant-associated protein D-like [Hyperolius riggenbachi]|uniref:pulmonary surfactant-associated protein D-like n=1 Tax=Hyperolius riggenbachi TaxID=752182 RepID=UPI0035A2C433
MPGIEGPRGPKGDLGPLGPKGDKGDSTNPGLDSRITRLEDQLKYLESNLLAKLKKQEKVLQYCEGTAQSGDKTYVSAGVQASFNDAQIACKKLGGELATPRNAAENVAVNSVVKYFKTSAYLGITDQKKDRVFRYPDGKPITYKNWSSTEPNNYGGKGEYCVEMYVDGAWNDIVCDLKRLAVCEII